MKVSPLLRWFRRDLPAVASRGSPAAPRPRQKGVALLLTLGVLALLLILAMSFAFTARTERAASAVNADMIRARLLCESGLERAMAYLGKSYEYPTTSAAADLFPATKDNAMFVPNLSSTPALPAAWDGRYYAVSMQLTPDQTFTETALAVNLGFDFTPKWSDQTGGSKLHANQSWQPIKDSTNTNLIGRIAFLIIDESGKIDPSAVITPEYEPFYSSPVHAPPPGVSEHWFDINGNGSFTNAAVAEGSEVRSGGSPQEINGENAFTGISSGGLVSGLPANAKRWFSWRHLRAGLWAAGAGNDLDEKAAVKTAFPFSYDIEAWMDPADKKDKHRFDLARPAADWPALGANDAARVDKLTASGTVSDFWNTATTPWTPSTTVTDRIPWLATMADTAGTSVTNQVAANFIDYCDNDGSETDDTPKATNDYTAATGTWPLGAGTRPAATYVGLEKVPYINEVSVTGELTETDAGGGNLKHELNIIVEGELVNIYDTARTASVTILVDFPTGMLPLTATSSDPATATLEGAICATPSITVNANSYSVASAIRTQFSFTWIDTITGTSVPLNVSDVFCVVTGTSDGSLWDYAHLGAASTAATVAPAAGLYCASWQVADPRCNLEDTRWAKYGFRSVSAGSTLGARNVKPDGSDANFANPSSRGSDDAETTTDPASAPPNNLSTAYIRNGPMKSLWELGCIHRSEPWRTINLTKCRDTSGGATAGQYAYGDADILDQVKLGPYTIVEGKFNANSPQASAWRAVLGGITVGATGYDAPGTGTALTPANVIAMIPYPSAATAGTILATNGAKAGTAAANRGAIARAAKLSDGTVAGVTQTTDRQKEEIIGKLANLLTVRQNYFTVVVTAQAVKDLGIVPTAMPAANRPTNWVKYDATNWCSVLAEQKIMAVVYRDAFTDKFRIERFEYLEE